MDYDTPEPIVRAKNTAYSRIANCINAYGYRQMTYIDDSPAAHRARILGMIFLFHQLFEDHNSTENLQDLLAEAEEARTARAKYQKLDLGMA